MEWLTKLLAITTLSFWKDPAVTKKGVALLFAGSTALLVCDRAAALGTEISTGNAIIGLIISLLTFIAQGVGGYISLLLQGPTDLVENAKRFARLMAVVWTTSLFIFFHNFFEPVFHELPSDWCVAGTYSLLAVGFFVAVATISGWNKNIPRAEVIKLGVVSIVVFLVNTSLFYIFVLYTRANQMLTDNIDELVLLFR